VTKREGRLPDISRASALLALIPLLMAFAFWWVHPQIAFDTDSQRYLDWSPMRTATYPLFLKALNGPLLLPIQLLLFAAALSWVAIAASRLLPWLVAAALVLAMAANPFLWQLQGTVMSEALTTPLLTLIVGCCLGYAVTRGPSLAIMAGLLGGIATTARPSLLPIVLAPLCLIWIAPRLPGRVKASVLVLVAFFAPIAAERVLSQLVHGPALTSPMGRQLFMKGAMIDAPPTPAASSQPLDQELARELNGRYEPVRLLLRNTRDQDLRRILLTNYESCAGYGCFTDDWARFPMSEAELHKHLQRVGLARLKSNPWGYLQLTASEYPRIWLLFSRKVPSIASKYNAFLARQGTIPFQDRLGEEGRATPAAEQRSFYIVGRAAFASIGILAALLTLVLAFRPRGSVAQTALALLLSSQAVLVFSAFLGSAQVRYAMGMWPTIIAGELLAFAALLAPWFPRLGLSAADRRDRAA